MSDDPIRPRVSAFAGDVPPYRFLKTGIEPEVAAANAMREMGIRHSCCALSLLWRLRKVALDEGQVCPSEI